jgi:hypothetical protein
MRIPVEECYPSGLTPEMVHALFGLAVVLVLLALLGAAVAWAAAVSALRSALRLYSLVQEVTQDLRRR